MRGSTRRNKDGGVRKEGEIEGSGKGGKGSEGRVEWTLLGFLRIEIVLVH